MLKRKEKSMKIPPIYTLGRFVVQNFKKDAKTSSALLPSKEDTVSFSASTAYYLKKYKTLPEEIKKILTPKDAIDMFKNMEMVQKGIQKGVKIGQGDYSSVFENPWLENYHFLIVDNPKYSTQLVYSRHTLGDSIWMDNDNALIQIIKAQ